MKTATFIMLVLGCALYFQSTTTNAQQLADKSDAITLAADKDTKSTTKKSYPLPEPLAKAITELITVRNQSERALLDYISSERIYTSQDELIRAAMFDRQQKLYIQYAQSIKAANDWVLAQRKDFNCDKCEAVRDAAGKWLFQEPELLKETK